MKTNNVIYRTDKRFWSKDVELSKSTDEFIPPPWQEKYKDIVDVSTFLPTGPEKD